MLRFGIPLGIFLILVVFLAIGLGLDPKEVPSPLINKPSPGFSLPVLNKSEEIVDDSVFKGKISLFNVWASWCSSCRYEHELLMYIQREYPEIQLIGLNYKDKERDALRYLKRLGNPYKMVLVDADGRVGINWGVYGTPETYLIDQNGQIRYKQIGPIDELSLKEKILPAVRALQGNGN